MDLKYSPAGSLKIDISWIKPNVALTFLVLQRTWTRVNVVKISVFREQAKTPWIASSSSHLPVWCRSKVHCYLCNSLAMVHWGCIIHKPLASCACWSLCSGKSEIFTLNSIIQTQLKFQRKGTQPHSFLDFYFQKFFRDCKDKLIFQILRTCTD